MTEGEFTRPRRALDPVENELDDTPTQAGGKPRRGQDWKPATQIADDVVPPPAGGKRFSTAALPEGHKSVARRSASSAVSPAHPPTPPEPTTHKPQVAALNVAFGQERRTRPARALLEDEEEAAADTEILSGSGRDRFKLWFWAVTTLAAIALIAGIAFAVTRQRSQATEEPAPSATPTTPPFAMSDLWNTTDLTPVAADTTWFIGQTLNQLSPASPRPACLTPVTGDAKPKLSAQRTLTTGSSLAALHQMDVFDTTAAAESVYAARLAAIAACNEAPAQILNAANVTGIGDVATLVTVAYQGTVTEYHTLLLVRSNTLISTFDVARRETAVSADVLVQAAVPALQRGCAVGGSCPSTPAITPGPPPVGSPAGWLIPADFPRITAGVGAWTATAPANITTTGSGCENLTLSSAPGPTARAQRTFVLTQDDKAPAGFGVDQLVFTLPDATQAAAFAKTLGDNIASCGTRLLTATVDRATPISAVVGKTPVAARLFSLTQATSANAKVYFQLALAQVGNKVAYLLINTNQAFRLSEDQFTFLVVRAAQRATQLPA